MAHTFLYLDYVVYRECRVEQVKFLCYSAIVTVTSVMNTMPMNPALSSLLNCNANA